MIKRINLTSFLLWSSLYSLNFGFCILGFPALAQMRKVICGYAIIVCLILGLKRLGKDSIPPIMILFLVFPIYGTIIGKLNGADLTGIVLDLTVVLQVFLAFELSYQKEDSIIGFLKKSAFLAIAVTFISMIINRDSLNINTLVNRGSIWSGTYYCVSLFWVSNYLIIIQTVTKKTGWIAYVSLVFAILLNALYLKRQIFFEVAVLLIEIIIYKVVEENKKLLFFTIKVLVITLVVITLVFICIQYWAKFDLVSLFIRIWERFNQVEETGFVRFEEAGNYFKSADYFDIILGKGYGVEHGGLGKENTALHIGIANLVLKNGIVFGLVFLVFAIKAIAMLFSKKRKKYSEWQWVSILASLNTIPSMFLLSNYWISTPLVCFVFYFFITLKKRSNPKKINYQEVIGL